MRFCAAQTPLRRTTTVEEGLPRTHERHSPLYLPDSANSRSESVSKAVAASMDLRQRQLERERNQQLLHSVAEHRYRLREAAG